MSLTVSGSRFVRVYDPTIDLKYSDKVIKARIVTSRKTGRKVKGEDGKERDERQYSEFPAQFVGAAFDQARNGLHGQTIDILSGWIIMDKYTGRDNMTRQVPTVFINDFIMSDLQGEHEAESGEDAPAP